MSMTKEEIIKKYEMVVEGGELVAPFMGEDVKEVYEMLKAGLSALRPITRERVAEVWGSEGWETVPDKGFVDTAGRQVYHLHCPHCGFFWRETGHAKYFRFCPACGAPMTDKAVDMVMERLEALYGQENT